MIYFDCNKLVAYKIQFIILVGEKLNNGEKKKKIMNSVLDSSTAAMIYLLTAK